MRISFASLCLTLLGTATLGLAQFQPIPADLELSKQLWSSIEQARTDGDSARALREFNKLLECYPNEPMLRAPLYLAMSELSTVLGDDAKARQYRGAALAIDPTLGGAIQPTSRAAGTRGSADQVAAVMAMAAQMMAQVQQMRAQQRATAAQPMAQPMQPAQANMSPAAPIGMPGAPGALPAQPAPGGFAGGPMSPGVPQVQAPVIVGYDANSQPIYGQPQPTVLQAAPSVGGPMSPGVPMPQPMQPVAQPMQPMPQPMQPVAQPMQPMPQPMQPIAQPMQPMPQPMQPVAQPMQPMPQPVQPIAQPMQPMPQPMQAAAQPMQPVQPPAQRTMQRMPQTSAVAAPPYNPNAWGGRAPVNPYAMRPGPNSRPNRGEQHAPLKLFYDRSHAGDSFYFDNPCAALIDVNSSGLLSITPSCGEAALAIPASDITALRMNIAVGKEVGAFHIETVKGFYLMLATPNGKREEALDNLRDLRTALHLDE